MRMQRNHVRASVYVYNTEAYNTEDEIEALLRSVAVIAG